MRCHEDAVPVAVGSNPRLIGVVVGHVVMWPSELLSWTRLSGPAEPGAFRAWGLSADFGTRVNGAVCSVKLACEIIAARARTRLHRGLCRVFGRLCWSVRGKQRCVDGTESLEPGIRYPRFFLSFLGGKARCLHLNNFGPFWPGMEGSAFGAIVACQIT